MIGDQTISGAEALKTSAIAALGDDAAKTIRLDMTKAGRIDVAGWQVLMALNRDAAAAGREVALHPDGTGAAEAARTLGISLGNPVD
jgi:ABC-type transporter Mla MlaB component